MYVQVRILHEFDCLVLEKFSLYFQAFADANRDSLNKLCKHRLTILCPLDARFQPIN